MGEAGGWVWGSIMPSGAAWGGLEGNWHTRAAVTGGRWWVWAESPGEKREDNKHNEH